MDIDGPLSPGQAPIADSIVARRESEFIPPPTPESAPVKAAAEAPAQAVVADAADSFSWLDPHPMFVILFVGGEEKPFGIQKDFLCAKSRYFRDMFKTGSPANGIHVRGDGDVGDNQKVELLVHLNDVSVEAFSYVQYFLYTGQVVPESASSGSTSERERHGIPSYDLLVSIWKLGHRFGIDGICESALEAMAEKKRLTHSIPATEILVQVWKDTPEGSSIRQLLLSWAAEYLRSSEKRRSEFAKALPQELLSELVVAMSSSFSDFWGVPTDLDDGNGESRLAENGPAGRANGKRYLEDDDYDSTPGGGDPSVISNGSIHARRSPSVAKRARFFDSFPVNNGTNASSLAVPNSNAYSTSATSIAGQKAIRTALPNTQRVFSKKRIGQTVDLRTFTPAQKLKFCSDLLNRMLSGPGFWTRLVGPFREPVDPSSEGIPDYFDIIKRPMDLGTIKANLDEHLYESPEEFHADMRQIFSNVYAYWKRTDTIWGICERLEKTFEEKYSHMNKWLGKLDDEVL
ncbi:hypothetical protein SEPCBS119000_002950 [Sporothrix epigloea]|uniref:Uncharacterized protein n=1 Tax=Sporothrix epigloea TaxID=1892477 RepID=A0ABP0DKT1_9PEZI